MISDSERREVAARLRAFDDSTADEIARQMRHLSIEELGGALVIMLGIAAALYDAGLETESIGGFWGLLADLIDCPTCRNVSGYQDFFECSVCGCRADLVTKTFDVHGKPRYVTLIPSRCPNCGAVVVEKEENDG